LLNHFLSAYRGAREVSFARETLTILRRYPFPGNVRELENLVKSALIECEGNAILPRHLPLRSMATFLEPQNQTVSQPQAEDQVMGQPAARNQPAQILAEELLRLAPTDWLELGYRESFQPYERAFDRVYLQHRLERARYNIAQAARDAGIDAKTFRKRWKDCGLPPLGVGEENADG
jgi:DNA-binding NtrC family response regulator